MFMKILLFASLLSFTLLTSCGERNDSEKDASADSNANAMKNDSAKSTTRIEILEAEGANLIDSNAAIENLAGGFSWTEGPVYIADGDYVLFSDIPANSVMKWKEGQGVTTYLHPSGYTGDSAYAPKNEPGSNGLILDKNGR
jgi:gluconolactonase